MPYNIFRPGDIIARRDAPYIYTRLYLYSNSDGRVRVKNREKANYWLADYYVRARYYPYNTVLMDDYSYKKVSFQVYCDEWERVKKTNEFIC